MVRRNPSSSVVRSCQPSNCWHKQLASRADRKMRTRHAPLDVDDIMRREFATWRTPRRSYDRRGVLPRWCDQNIVPNDTWKVRVAPITYCGSPLVALYGVPFFAKRVALMLPMYFLSARLLTLSCTYDAMPNAEKS